MCMKAVVSSGLTCSTVGRMLASRLTCPFYEGDDYHPQANKGKPSCYQSCTASVPANTAEWLQTKCTVASHCKMRTGGHGCRYWLTSSTSTFQGSQSFVVALFLLICACWCSDLTSWFQHNHYHLAASKYLASEMVASWPPVGSQEVNVTC